MTVNTLITLRAIGRSGSLFLQQLFENHSQLVMLPVIIDFYGRWNTFFAKSSGDVNELLNYYIKDTNIKCLLGEKNSLFSWVDQNNHENYVSLDLNAYLEQCILFINLSDETNFRKRILLALHQAYYQLAGLKWPDNPILFLHEHQPYFFEETDQDFFETKHIATLRRPEDMYASYSKFFQKSGGLYGPLYLQYSLKVATEGYLNALHYHSKFPEKLYFVQTELLNTQPEVVLKKLANWLNISYEDVLLQPTFFGFPAKNNSAFDPNVSTFNKDIAEKSRFDEICSNREKVIIQNIFSDLNKDFYNIKNRKSILLSIFVILIPDLAFIFLRKYSLKDVLYYLVSLNFIWSRINFIYCLRMIKRKKKEYIYPNDISDEMGYLYKNWLQKLIFFK
ncbi:MAG: hypothetical protein AB7I41_02275 [Candidatus Sericytochromatia bacterium]